ncbi:Conserved hypothetical protein CHP02231 [Aphelenchoides avenae]|nr:Conserved hypothetical protein CHP02231 [Aphelenchus avenae]
MDLTYQVYDASWTPSYDVRITTDPVATTKAQMKLYYFGNIRQNTGEEWKDVQLVLSTAQPRLAGPLPKLGTLRAKFHKEEPAQAQYQVAPQYMMMRTEACMDAAPMRRMAKMAHQTMQAEKQSLSTTFLVPQSKTIPSDSSDHKVTIVCLQFEPLLHLDCVPSKDTNVFLTASTLNCSDYPLLAGFASIYVDNSFSSKVIWSFVASTNCCVQVHIDAVATGDKFDCPVGVDSTIKIQYKPANTFQQQSGVMTKTASSLHEQKVLVKNTKTTEPILLTFYEQVPKSTDEKIKVKLYSPEVKATQNHTALGTNEDLKTLKLPDVGPRLNGDHNLEWTVLLSEGEERELVIKWGVESPANETIDYEEDQQ